MPDDILDDADFYILMQAYRHTAFTDQRQVVIAFDAIKSWIRKNFSPQGNQAVSSRRPLLRRAKANPARKRSAE